MLVLAAIASLVPRLPSHGVLRLGLRGPRRARLVAGVPVIAEYLDTSYVSKLPSAVLAVALMLCAALSFAAGTILDSVARANRRRWELEVYRVMGE